MLFRIRAFLGDVRILYIFVVIPSFPVPDPNILWYVSYVGIIMSCKKVDDVSEDGLVKSFMSSSSKSNQVQISSIF